MSKREDPMVPLTVMVPESFRQALNIYSAEVGQTNRVIVEKAVKKIIEQFNRKKENA